MKFGSCKIECRPIKRLLRTDPIDILRECNGISTGGRATIDSRPASLVGSEINPLSIAGPVGSVYAGDICDQLSRAPFGHVGQIYFPAVQGTRVKRYLFS